MNRKYRNLVKAAAVALLAGSVWSCDDKISLDDPAGGTTLVDPEEYALGFNITLAPVSDDGASGRSTLSSDPTAYENFIDINKLRVMLFTKSGKFLYEFPSPDPVPLSTNPAGENQWFIKVPVKDIDADVMEVLKTQDFKISVMANWPTREEAAGRYAQYNFSRGVNDATDDANYDGELLSHLSHFFLDDNYLDEDDGEDAYGHIALKGSNVPEGWTRSETEYQAGHYYMGVSTQWNDYLYKSREAVEAAFRDSYDVDNGKFTGYAPKSGGKGRDYKDVWQVWNFGGEANAQNLSGSDVTFYNSTNSDVKNKWMDLQAELMEKATDNGTAQDFNVRGLKYKARSSANYKIVEDDNGNKAFQMPRRVTSVSAANSTNVEDLQDGYFTIDCPKDVTVRFKLGAHIDYDTDNSGESHNIWLGWINQNDGKRGVIQVFKNEDYTAGQHFAPVIEGSVDLDITYYPKDIVFYAITESGHDALMLYEVEYICPYYVYLTDRYALMPSAENPIPMYGVQDFGPIGEYWEKGVLFNLSAYNGYSPLGYHYRNVSLIRSLARVDLLIPKALFPEPETVFMRTMNHSARCAPLDVYTPTDIIWKGYPAEVNDDRTDYEGFVGVAKELENIITYGPNYQANNTLATNPSGYLKDFRQRIAWFFGIWNEPKWGWEWNVGTGMPQEITRADVRDEGYPYPRVFNTAVSRADYTTFARIDDPNYYHYVMYVPEKNICDADDPGELGDRPKLIHMEFRFKDRNPEENYDDNSAYRIYFTPGGLVKVNSIEGRNKLDQYETSPDIDILSQHYPVLRNHNYRFTVTGINQGDLNFQVRSAATRDVNIDFE